MIAYTLILALSLAQSGDTPLLIEEETRTCEAHISKRSYSLELAEGNGIEATFSTRAMVVKPGLPYRAKVIVAHYVWPIDGVALTRNGIRFLYFPPEALEDMSWADSFVFSSGRYWGKHSLRGTKGTLIGFIECLCRESSECEAED